MSNERKPHRKDRYDGYYVQKLDAMHVIMPYVMPNRTDNEAVMKETVDMTPVLEYLEEKNSKNPKFKYTIMHVVMAAIAKAIYLRPKMNYFISDYKMYERKDISFSFTAKNQMSDNAGETLLIFRLDRESDVSPVEQIHDYVSNAKKVGLQVHACYMVGNEGETRETMNETLRLALELNTDTAQFYPLLPFPGTESYLWAKTNGYLKGNYSDYVKEDGTINCILELPNLSSEDMVSFCDYARKKYYMRPSYILHRLIMGLKDPNDLKRSVKAFMSLKKYLFN